MKTNVKENITTYEGAKARRVTGEALLRRLVTTCMLWEDMFYVDGKSAAEQLDGAASSCAPKTVMSIAVEARNKYYIRHAPLMLALNLAKRREGKYLAQTLRGICKRLDDCCEFVALYWKDGKKPLPAQAKKALAWLMNQFDAYQFGKYRGRNMDIKPMDIINLVHPKPKDAEQSKIFKQLLDDTLSAPDTWEVRLTRGEDHKEVFTDLLTKNKLGGLALLRNLRNMLDHGVDRCLIKESILNHPFDNVLPYRFISAAKAVPEFEEELDRAMVRKCSQETSFPGKTLLLVDVSGSMGDPIGGKSDVRRMQVASSLAVLLRERCEEPTIYSFSNSIKLIPNRQGMALVEAIYFSQSHSGTYLNRALRDVDYGKDYDRLIIITDEQSRGKLGQPKAKMNVCINVAPYNRSVCYNSNWINISGWSDRVVDFLYEIENDK